MLQQKGMTIIKMLFIVASLIVIGVLGMQVIPVYIQNYEIRSSINALGQLDASVFPSDEPDAATIVPILKNRLMNQFYINGFSELKPEQITVTPTKPGSYTVAVKYVVVRTLTNTISLIFDFNESEEVTVGPK